MKKILSLCLAVLLLTALPVTAFAADTLALDGYVTDGAGLLRAGTEQALEQAAGEISQAYGRGVYLIVVDDYTKFGGGNLYTTAGDIYLAGNLGLGEYHDGILLLLSMEDRQAALITYDGSGQFVTAEGKDWLAQEYLPHFREDAWEAGFRAYIDGCETLLEMAAEGKPMTRQTMPGARGYGLVVSLVLGFVLAWIVVKILEGTQKSVFRAVTAEDYVAKDGVKLLDRSDLFLRRSTTRRRIEKSSSGGGNSSGGSRRSDSRGFSGRTDRF